MKKIFGLMLLGLGVGTSGCLNTFYPVFNKSDIHSGQPVMGNWSNDKEQLVITKAPANTVLPEGVRELKQNLLVVKGYDNNGEESYANLAFLVKIDKYYFLDMFPAYTELELTLDPLYRNLFLKQHSIYRVDSFQTGSTLQLLRVSDELIMDQIQKKKIKIPMITRSDQSIILASTSELQKHIVKYASDPVFYEDDKAPSYHRIK